jgi:hypothetical protein
MSSAPAPFRICSVILVALFLLVISMPLAANLAGDDGADAKAENRELAQFPEWTGDWTSVAAYAGGFDAWFEDHFGFRARLVRWFGESRYFGLHVSPAATVVRGKGSWLFYADDFSLDDYANDRPFSTFDLNNWRESTVRARDWLRAQGIAYLFTVAPDKYMVYPEDFPASVRRLGTASRMDQLNQSLADTHVSADTLPALLDAKRRERTYYLTDTHWNDRGAFAAYRQIIDVVRRQNAAVPPAWPRSDFDAGSREIEGKDLAGMMGLTRVLHEDDLPLIPTRPRLARVVEPAGADPKAEIARLVTEIPGSKLPRALVLRDSFASGLAPFLSEHFSRVVYLWQNDFDANAVRAEHPDVVIQEIVSRHLYSFVPSPELVPR